MFSVMVTSFVVVCCLMVITASVVGIWRMRAERVVEVLVEPILPRKAPRMDIPQKYGVLRTRSSRRI